MTAVTSATSASTNTATASNAVDNTMIASNFTTFLQLLTTQLKNQNPLDPLDTNQFTQQLVQFAQVEQQMKSNDQLSTLISLDKNAQADHRAGLCRRHRCGRRLDRQAHRRPGDLGIHRRETFDRHHHDQGFDRLRTSTAALSRSIRARNSPGTARTATASNWPTAPTR